METYLTLSSAEGFTLKHFCEIAFYLLWSLDFCTIGILKVRRKFCRLSNPMTCGITLNFHLLWQYFRTFSGNIKSKDTLFYLHACVCVLSHVQLFVIPWTVACQVPLSIEFSSQQYWSGLLFPILGIFLTQRSNPHLLHWQVNFYYCATWNTLKQRQKRQMISLLFTHHYSSFIISYCVGFFIS